MMMLPVVTLLFTGCSSEPEESSQTPEGNFGQAHTVRIVSPEQGERVEPSFVIEYEVGANVRSFDFLVDGAPISLTNLDEAGQTLAVTVDEGRRQLQMVGYDGQGSVISDYSISVNAVSEGPWVTLTSPIDGDTVYNPVTFVVDADPVSYTHLTLPTSG